MPLVSVLRWAWVPDYWKKSSNNLQKLIALVLVATLANFAFTIRRSFAEPSKAEKYCSVTQMRPLPGALNQVPCFNSNSPELVLKEGILLSTFPADNMKNPEAHLNYAFDGNFDIFSHHIARNDSSEDQKTLYLGFIAFNPSNKRLRIQVLSGASYLSQPDAPFLPLSEIKENKDGSVFAGPGDRVSNDVLRGRLPSFLPRSFYIDPGQTRVFLSLPIPVRELRPALNGRSTLIKLHSNGPLYLASLAKFSEKSDKSGPSDDEYLDLLYNGKLAGPRENQPSPPGQKGSIRYGRVSGVAKGSEWQGDFSENKDYPDLKIAPAGDSISCPISTVEGGSFGTGQVQSAELLRRYGDTAYAAHGNYGVRYRLSAVLRNPFEEPLSVQILFQSALKSDEQSRRLCFLEGAPPRAFYRGTIAVDDGSGRKFWHLVLRQGSEGAKLAEFNLPPGQKRRVSLDFIYPADATPPQEICIKTVRAKESED
ncbi:MAG: DUF3370 domain-containing protein [Candidatus Obscuribacterales bacterium]|nr:DUF3370 domain-containing protein [Candidatus Obscuribacterales bacterium]